MRRSATALALAAVLVAWPAILEAQAVEATGRVTITYTLTRQSRIASDQLAVWIEDAEGRFLRTLFVTDFTGRRAGWSRRPQSLPTWVRTAGVRDAAQADIDAVSGATPRSGTHSVVWDLKDALGRAVPPGTYRYRLEGNISWENTVLWSGTVRVGGGRELSRAAAAHSPPEAQTVGILLSDVSPLYEPSR